MKRTLFFLTITLVATGLVAQQPEANKKNAAWDLIKTQNDKDKDGKVTADEYTRGEVRFKRLDRDKDGVLTEKDFEVIQRRGRRGRGSGRRGASANMIFGRLMDTDGNQEVTRGEVIGWVKTQDKNKDGKISKDEFGNPRRAEFVIGAFDKDGDGALSEAEFTKPFDEAAGKSGVIKVRRRRGRGERRPRPRDGAPKVGVAAPDFNLSYKDGKKKAKLSSFKGKKPVALIFGSYT